MYFSVIDEGEVNSSVRPVLFISPRNASEAMMVEEMKNGMTLREAQEALIAKGVKKNAVKQAALTLKKLFE